MFWVPESMETRFLPLHFQVRIAKARSLLGLCVAEFLANRFLWEELGLESHLGWAILGLLLAVVLTYHLPEDPTCLGW